MAKLKNLIMDVQEKVQSCNFEDIITESDTVQEAQNIVSSLFKKEFTSFEMDIAKDYVCECWNEYWGDYVQ